MAALRYRADIDGLRAVAVLSVVLFHAGFWPFSGGFVGVDIFFVISGYLISSIILKDIAANRFSIARFYERRVRRIIPALAAVTVAVTIAALILYTPSTLRQYGERLTYASLFAANIEFYRISNYFGPKAGSIEILHYWSLAVEEQFYVLFPVFLLVLSKFSNKLYQLLLLLAAGAVSFAASLAVQQDHAIANFYLLPFRGWEFICGTMIALEVLRKPGAALAEALSLGGIACLAISVVAFDRSTPFPGIATLLPCLGAAMVIYAGSSDRRTVVCRALSNRAVVFVGLISYSLYLWHWPMLVMLGYYLDRPLGAWETAAAIGLSFVLAILSWRYVERPFRRPAGSGRPLAPVLLSGGATLLALALAGCILVAGHGFPSRLGPEAAAADAAADDAPEVTGCLDVNGSRASGRCGPDYHVFVWGDSHVEQFIPAIASLAPAGKVGRFGTGGCPPLPGLAPVVVPPKSSNVSAPVDNKAGEKCRKVNAATIRALRSRSDVRLVVFGAAWQFFTVGKELGTGEGRFLAHGAHARLSVAANRQLMRDTLFATVSQVRRMGIPVLILGDNPIYSRFPGECIAKARMYHRDGNLCGRSSNDVLSDLQFSNQMIRNIAQMTGSAYFLPSDVLCSGSKCLLKRDGHYVYRDADHITASAARDMAPNIAHALSSNTLARLGRMDGCVPTISHHCPSVR